MKPITCLLTSALFIGANLFAQIPGMTSTQISSSSDGTALGSNETLAYSGIALGNAVKLRGYVDFIYKYEDAGSSETSDFTTASDIDFLFDMSPVTAEVHLNLTDDNGSGGVGLEQAFGRYSFNQNLHLTFGRQLTPLGFDADEGPGLYTVSNSYTNGAGYINNYVDGLRLNYNNGQFGLVAGLHDSYWTSGNTFKDGVALDLAASVMIMPGLEAQIGYAYEEVGTTDDITQFNTFVSYNTGSLTLALEYDYYDLTSGEDLMDFMGLVNFSFTDWFAATLRYTYENADVMFDDAHRFTLALLFTVTDNLYFNTEYSHSSTEAVGGGSTDVDEFYVEGLLTF